MTDVIAIPEIPYEKLVCAIHGNDWRDLSENDLDGVWGVAIVRSILDGVRPSMREIISHLGVGPETIRDAFMRLSLNGIFLRGRIYSDRQALNKHDIGAWCQYAGIASGATGNVTREPRKRKEHS